MRRIARFGFTWSLPTPRPGGRPLVVGYDAFPITLNSNARDYRKGRATVTSMPRVDSDIKLDFKDVLLRPKRSTLRSRADVSYRACLFTVCCPRACVGRLLWRGSWCSRTQRKRTRIPVIAANMDTVGTFEMGVTFANHRLKSKIL